LDSILFATDRGVEDLVVAYEGHGEIGYDVDLPPTFRLHPGAPGIVEVRDGRGRARLRVRAERAWDASGAEIPLHMEVSGATLRVRFGATATYPVAVDPVWEGTDSMVVSRRGHSATLLSNGEVLIAGGASGILQGELYDPSSGTFRLTSPMGNERISHRAIRTGSGEVLVVGGVDAQGRGLNTVEVYDPHTGLFSPSGPLSTARIASALALLPDGRVLCAGGGTTSAALSSTEIWDPATRAFSPSAAMATPRTLVTAVPLHDGGVLVAGGWNAGQPLSSAEVFDPIRGRFDSVSSMMRRRGNAALITLPNGHVLTAGGRDNNGALAYAEVFDTDTREFSTVGDMSRARAAPMGLLLPSGKPLVTGATGEAFGPSDFFDARTGQFLPTPFGPLGDGSTLTLLPSGAALATGGMLAEQSSSSTASVFLPSTTTVGARELPLGVSGAASVRLADGDVLVLGGVAVLLESGSYAPYRGTFRFCPETMRFRENAALPSDVRFTGGVTLLSDGRVFVADNGGFILDPVSNQLTVPPATAERSQSSAIRLNDGRVLVTGGRSPTGGTLASAEVYDPGLNSAIPVAPMSVPRCLHASALLPSGEVLVAGGFDPSMPYPEMLRHEAEIFDPATGTFRTTDSTTRTCDQPALRLSDGSVFLPCWDGYEIFDPVTETFLDTPSQPVSSPAAALLEDGRVVMTGGWAGDPPSRQISVFDPVSRVCSSAGELNLPRVYHNATALGGTRVLVAGGIQTSSQFSVASATAEVFDVATGQSTLLSPAVDAYAEHAATVLASGQVLVTGGLAHGSPRAQLVDAENPEVGEVLTMSAARSEHTSTLLRNWKVLITGGRSWNEAVASAELFDPEAKTFEELPAMSVRRMAHAATLLPSGKVLISGGSDETEIELFDPSTCRFEGAGNLSAPRASHAAVLLSTGEVVVAGGVNTTADPDHASVSVVEIVDPRSGTVQSLDAETSPSGPTVGTVTADGTVLLADQSMIYRFVAETRTLEPLSASVGMPIGAGSLWTGETLFCGITWLAAGCAQVGPGAVDVGPVRSFSTQQTGGTVSFLPTGGFLFQSPRNEGPGLVSHTSSLPEGVVRPVILDAPRHAPVKETLHVKGARFMRPSAVGSENQPAYPGIMPIALFMPAAGGGPIYAHVTQWQDDSLEATVPPTAYHGPGWLHVVVEGVPSVGFPMVLEPLDLGASCSLPLECASEWCVEGVCCSGPCEGACESCLGSLTGGQDGQCLAVPEGQDPKEACGVDEAKLCGRTGVCDGARACALVRDGTECEPEKVCRHQECTATLGLPCTSNLDCALGQVCGADRACWRIRSNPYPTDVGSCAVGSASRPGGLGIVLVLIAVEMRRRRRRK
jgi:WD40 repeat protein